MFPFSTNKPSFPSSIISFGPHGQSKEIGGTPHDMASVITIPNPSKREEGRIGTVVYLKLPYRELERRLSDIKGRGVVLRDGQTLHDLYEERVPLYEKYADVIVDEHHLNVEQTIEKIMELKERFQ